MDKMRDIVIRGRFHKECQGCTKLVLERNAYDNVWTCCFYYQCNYQLCCENMCIGTTCHKELEDEKPEV